MSRVQIGGAGSRSVTRSHYAGENSSVVMIAENFQSARCTFQLVVNGHKKIPKATQQTLLNFNAILR